MVSKILERSNEDALREINRHRRTSFHEHVSSSHHMYKFYDMAISISGFVEKVNSSEKPLLSVNIGAGGGVLEDRIKRQAKKDFIAFAGDIDKMELGKSDWKEKVILDMTHLPIADKKADVVWRLNPPSPIAGVKDYIVNLQPASHAEFKENRKVLVLLGFVSGAVDMLNVLEAVRVMKDDGVFVEGMPYREDSVNELTGILDGMRSALKKRGLDMGAAPLKQVKYEIFELDRRINEMWSKYGVELDLIDHKPFFFVGSYSKNETKLDLWFNEAKKSLSSPLGQLSKIERFWEIIDDMGKSKKLDNFTT